MSAWLSRLRGPNNEGLLVAVIVLVAVAMGIANPVFFSANTFFALVRSSMVQLMTPDEMRGSVSRRAPDLAVPHLIEPARADLLGAREADGVEGASGDLGTP